MKLDENFDPSADEYALPDKLLERIEALWKGLKKVVVDKKVKKSWKKVNGFDVHIGGKGQADDDPEEVATMIVAMAATDVEDEGEEGTYRARFVRDVNGKEDRSKSFTFKQGFGDASEGVFDASDPSAMHMMGMAWNQQVNLVSVLTQHNENLVNRVLEQSTSSTKQIEQLLKTNETLVQQYHQGLAMQANALSQIMDVEANREEAKQRGANTKALLDMMKMALPAALTQFGKYMRAKAGDEVEDDDEEDEESTEDEEGGDGDSSADGEDEGDDAKAELQKKLRTKPLTTFAHAFKDSLSTDQLLALSQALTKSQMRALIGATDKDNDEDTAEGILKLYEAILKKPEKLADLQEILSEQQVQMVLRLSEKAQAHQDGTPE